MGTSVQVTPLCGVYSESPLCYLLSINGFSFLMDCGWNDLFDPNLLQPLSRVAKKVHAVLLSHPDILHLGALPYAMKQFGLSTPVYSIEPVFRLGLLTMYDHYLSRRHLNALFNGTSDAAASATAIFIKALQLFLESSSFANALMSLIRSAYESSLEATPPPGVAINFVRKDDNRSRLLVSILSRLPLQVTKLLASILCKDDNRSTFSSH